MNARRLKPSGTVLLAAVALVIGLEAPAMAHQVNVAAHKISGSELKNNSVTGKQIKESTLGTVPRARLASKLPPLTWHSVTLTGDWASTGDGFAPPSYAVDSRGLVYLRGALHGGANLTVAFTLPSAARPHFIVQLPVDEVLDATGQVEIDPDGDVSIADDPAASGGTNQGTSLDGVVFATSR